MHIVFVLPPGEPYTVEWSGAIATITRYLARELVSLGVRVTVVTPDDPGTLHAEGEVVPLRFGRAHPVPALVRKLDALLARKRGWVWPEYRRYWRAVKASLGRLGSADVVVLANDPLTADRVARQGRWETVLWLHNYLAGTEAQPLAHLSPAVRVVAVSNDVAEWTRQHHLPSTAIAVIHSGVDTDLFRRRDDLATDGHLRVVCHGRIDPNKGHDVAAAAVARVRAEGLPVQLTVIGEVRTFGHSPADVEAYRARLEAAIQSADGTRLPWLSHRDLAVELRRHDVACMLSVVHEPFGLVNLEAMASGCAMIATRTGGIPEVVGDAGVLVEPGDVDQVADQLRRWAGDPAQLGAAKRAAVARADQFTWAETARALLGLVTQGEARSG